MIARMRPFSENERKANEKKGWGFDMVSRTVTCLRPNSADQAYAFDSLFDDSCSTETVYQASVKTLIQGAVNGIDTTIYAFGQTGAGKTHTMIGVDEGGFQLSGVVFQSMEELFQIVSCREQEEQYLINLSCTEVYNEQVFDLLAKHEDLNLPLQIFEDQDANRFRVKGQTKVRVDSVEEVKKVLFYAESNRRYSETYFNHVSSRSHAIFEVSVKKTSYSGDEAAIINTSIINIVDLAGNERLLYDVPLLLKPVKRDLSESRSGSQLQGQRSDSKSDSSRQLWSAKGDRVASDAFWEDEKSMRMLESKNINKSLFFLTQIIQMCSADKKPTHVPFRNSALTKILKPSFGGNSRTLILLCVSPCMSDVDVTISTFRFGKCAKKIVSQIKPNITTTLNKDALEAIINSYERKIEEAVYKGRELQLIGQRIDGFGQFVERVKAFIAKASLAKADRVVAQQLQRVKEEAGWQLEGKGVQERELLSPSCGILMHRVRGFEAMVRESLESKDRRGLCDECRGEDTCIVTRVVLRGFPPNTTTPLWTRRTNSALLLGTSSKASESSGSATVIDWGCWRRDWQRVLSH